MNILDLNHLEAVEGTEVVGGFGFYSYYQNDFVKLNVKTKIDLEDNSAEAFADSRAFGRKSFTKTFTDTYADNHSSGSSSGSFAAVD